MELLLKSFAYTLATLVAIPLVPILLLVLLLGELIDHFDFYAAPQETFDAQD